MSDGVIKNNKLHTRGSVQGQQKAFRCLRISKYDCWPLARVIIPHLHHCMLYFFFSICSFPLRSAISFSHSHDLALLICLASSHSDSIEFVRLPSQCLLLVYVLLRGKCWELTIHEVNILRN